MLPQILEGRIRKYLEDSNDGAPGMSDEAMDEACEILRTALDRAFNQTRSNFKVSMSAAGRPACQLVMQRNGVEPIKKTAGFAMKMLIGHITEAVLMSVIRSSNIPVESAHGKVDLPLDDHVSVRGTYDLEVDGEIWDIKSASHWSFRNKWVAGGFEAVEASDSFGYCAQLYGYSKASGKAVGGWFVVDKESGDIAVVKAKDTPEYRKKHLTKLRESTYKVLDLDREFTREFEDEPEKFRSKETGNRKLGFECSWCDFKEACWPGIKHLPEIPSKAKNKKLIWYTHVAAKEAEVTGDATK